MCLSRIHATFLSLTLLAIIATALYVMLAPKAQAFDREKWSRDINRTREKNTFIKIILIIFEA
jgi:heme/copper-type cytochrome/quinol oxidase subunit 2